MILQQAPTVGTASSRRAQIRSAVRVSTAVGAPISSVTPLNIAAPSVSGRAAPARPLSRPPAAAATGVPSATDAARGAKVLDNVYDVVVVGGGLSGLVTAQALAAQHNVQNFLVTEARERVGGNITTMAGEGYIWEEGPNSFQPNDSMLQIAVDSGCEKDLVFGDPKAPRFVFWEGRLRPVPSGLDALTFDLMSLPGKIRAGLGAVGLLKAPAPAQEESVEGFIRRNLGAEVFERLIEPFCSGVYAGNPAKLSMKAAFQKIWILEQKGGSLVGGAIKLMQERSANPPPPRDPRLPPKPKGQTVGSFRKGLKMLPEAIEKKIKDKIRVNWKLAALTREGEAYSLVYDTPEGRVLVRARAVALTAPSYVVSELLQAEVPAASSALSQFDYPPVGAVTLAYPVSAVREDRKAADGSVPGFGQLHPRTQGVTTLGTIYCSSLFPGRAPSGEIMLLNYIGGTTNRGIVNQTKEQLVEQVDKDLRAMLLRPDAPKPRTVGVRVWPRAIPQFNIGHLELLDAARSALDAKGWRGVFLGGNYVSGVALGKVVEYGYESAAALAAHLAKQPAASKSA